jgi:hypothetical protein
MSYELKHIGGMVTEAKEVVERDGVRLGQIEGFIATWDLDEGFDRFKQGAFKQSLVEHKRRHRRPVRLLSQHHTLIGGWPIAGVVENEIGLFGVGEINLDTVEGANVFALAKQGVLTDLSVGFSARDFGFIEEDAKLDSEPEPRKVRIRLIKKATLWEGSIVDEPMNRAAVITSVKHFADLRIQERGRVWNEYEGDDPDAFVMVCGKRFAIASEDAAGELAICPEQLMAASLLLIEDPDPESIGTLERYLAKLGEPSPFPAEQREFFGATDVKAWTQRDLEQALQRCGTFSKSAAKLLAGALHLPGGESSLQDAEDRANLLGQLNDSLRRLKTSI